MEMRDRVTQGFIAGVIGAIVQMIVTLGIYYGAPGSLNLRYMDFAAAIAWGHRPEGLLESIVAELVVWTFNGFLGVAFAFLFKILSSKNLIIKGTLLGALTWFFIYAFVTAFRVEGLYSPGFQTAVIQLLGGLIFGAVTAKTYAYLAEKYQLDEQQTVASPASYAKHNPIAQPAMKPLNNDDANEK